MPMPPLTLNWMSLLGAVLVAFGVSAQVFTIARRRADLIPFIRMLALASMIEVLGAFVVLDSGVKDWLAYLGAGSLTGAAIAARAVMASPPAPARPGVDP
jgi:hypothetical protein